MRLLNIMFGRGLGGIEQAFLDYSEMLAQQGHDVTSVTQPDSKVMPALRVLNTKVFTLKTLNQWDLLAIFKFKRFIREYQPDVIIAHGNRAVSIAKWSAGDIPVIGVVHNYSFKRMIGLAGVCTVTKALRQAVINAGQSQERVFHIPNIIRVTQALPPVERHSPPVIGVMARFVKKKGVDTFLRALALLEQQGLKFRAVIAGDGEERSNLNELCNTLKLQSEVIFAGWAHDKAAFYNNIDIFCLPSLHEPFGIVLLEAMLHRKPIVTTDSEGPQEIVTPGKDALMVTKQQPEIMAQALARLIQDVPLAEELAVEGFHTVAGYDLSRVGEHLTRVVEKVANVPVKA